MKVKRKRMVVPLGGNQPTQEEVYEVEVPDDSPEALAAKAEGQSQSENPNSESTSADTDSDGEEVDE